MKYDMFITKGIVSRYTMTLNLDNIHSEHMFVSSFPKEYQFCLHFIPLLFPNVLTQTVLTVLSMARLTAIQVVRKMPMMDGRSKFNCTLSLDLILQKLLHCLLFSNVQRRVTLTVHNAYISTLANEIPATILKSYMRALNSLFNLSPGHLKA